MASWTGLGAYQKGLPGGQGEMKVKGLRFAITVVGPVGVAWAGWPVVVAGARMRRPLC